MKTNHDDPVYLSVLNEQNQGHITRRKLYIDLEKELQMPVVSFFTSFHFPVLIQDDDAKMIEGLLQKIDLTKGLALIVNSPGGIGLAAERIINVCNSYSGTGGFITIVPGMAKSAATMLCMGSSKILMSKTSELGPIDPQVQLLKDNNKFNIAVFNVVQSYRDLFNEAVKTTGNLQPYLQQLALYDARQIKDYEAAIELSEDVAIRALHSGMMNGTSKEEIRKKIKVFLTPEETKSHGRSIFYDEAKKCGLKIELMDLKSQIWKLSYELCVRSDNYTKSRVAKCIENKDFSFAASYN
jgi:ClpP class serine protease